MNPAGELRTTPAAGTPHIVATPDADAPKSRLGRRHAGLLALLFVLAFLVRFALVSRVPGGLGGNVNDDSAAYYAGATALVHGRLPYADFVLLHPPLTDLLLTPFAALGLLIGDHAGFMAANVFAELVGAANAVLVVLVARRYGLAFVPALFGGLFYALWLGTARGESVIALETFGNTALLLGLLALAGPLTRRSTVLGGLAIGAAVTAKIVWVVPAVVIVGWWLVQRRTRTSTPWLVAGVVAAPIVICGVFFAVAPRAMVRMVLVDQVGRPPQGSVWDHVRLFSDIQFVRGGVPHTTAVLTVGVVLIALVLGFAWRRPPFRLVVALAVAQLAVLFYSPSYFGHYAVYAGPALALVLAGAAATAARPFGLAGRAIAALVFVLAVVITASLLSTPQPTQAPFPRTAIAKLIRGTRCPTPDAPIVLIETDQLSRSLDDGCPNWIDVTGRVYDVDRPKPGAGFSRAHNKRWQRSLNRYLFSGDVVIVMRPKLGIGVRLQRRLDQLPLLFDQDGIRVYRTMPLP